MSSKALQVDWSRQCVVAVDGAAAAAAAARDGLFVVLLGAGAKFNRKILA